MKVSDFFLAVFMEKIIKKFRYLNYVRKRIIVLQDSSAGVAGKAGEANFSRAYLNLRGHECPTLYSISDPCNNKSVYDFCILLSLIKYIKKRRLCSD